MNMLGKLYENFVMASTYGHFMASTKKRLMASTDKSVMASTGELFIEPCLACKETFLWQVYMNMLWYQTHCKLVHKFQSLNCTTFTANFRSLLWINYLSVFSPKIPMITSSYKIVCKKKCCLCPEVGIIFCYFTLTLCYFYTHNTWKSTLKPFHKVVDMVKIFHLQP